LRRETVGWYCRSAAGTSPGETPLAAADCSTRLSAILYLFIDIESTNHPRRFYRIQLS